MTWNGFNDSLVNFVGETIRKICACREEDCQDIFDQVKEQLSQEWKNYYLNQVFRLAYAEIDTMVYANDNEKSKLSQILEGFTYERFKIMSAQWLRHGRMLWYVYGNVSKDQAKLIVDGAVQSIGLQPMSKDDLCDVRVVDLSSQSDNFHRLDFDVPDASNENHCLISYFQHSRVDMATTGDKFDLLNRLVTQFLQEPTFDQLRTKEQLGYVVFT